VIRRWNAFSGRVGNVMRRSSESLREEAAVATLFVA
jgi:hypothetical protein